MKNFVKIVRAKGLVARDVNYSGRPMNRVMFERFMRGPWPDVSLRRAMLLVDSAAAARPKSLAA